MMEYEEKMEFTDASTPDVRIPRRDEPQRMTPCPAEIIKAKVAVMRAVHGVGQTGHNSFHNYDYASSADVLKAVREAMVENGLALEAWPVDVDKDEDGNMRVKFLMQWQHESGAVADPLPWYGIANDRDKSGRTGDKWFNKAATAAEKYFFLKQFHIPSEKGFDPDEGNAATDGDNAPAKAAPKAKAKEAAGNAKENSARTFVQSVVDEIGAANDEATVFAIWDETHREKIERIKEGYPNLYGLLEVAYHEKMATFNVMAAG